MTNEVFFDTTGFFTVMDECDDLHQKAVEWLRSRRGQVRPVTTEWVVGETCSAATCASATFWKIHAFSVWDALEVEFFRT